VAVLATVAMTASRADAQERTQVELVSATSPPTQFASMQAELDAMRAQIEEISYSNTNGGVSCSSSCGSGSGCNSGCWDWWTNPNCGITFMGEALWLRAEDSEDDGDNTFFDASRITLGYVNNCGRELRVRFFEFGASPHYDAGFYNLYTIDVEYAGRFQWGRNWAGDFSVGVRDAKYREERGNDYPATIGPLIGLHLKSAPLFRNINAFGNLRYSQQFGTAQDDNDMGTFGITEAQVGLEWSRRVCAGDVFARASLESQEWAGPEDDDSENLGLIGVAFALGLSR